MARPTFLIISVLHKHTININFQHQKKQRSCDLRNCHNLTRGSFNFTIHAHLYNSFIIVRSTKNSARQSAKFCAVVLLFLPAESAEMVLVYIATGPGQRDAAIFGYSSCTWNLTMHSVRRYTVIRNPYRRSGVGSKLAGKSVIVKLNGTNLLEEKDSQCLVN